MTTFGAVDHPDDTFVGPWFTSRIAAAYVGNKSLKAWYSWRDRHGIVTRSNGTVAKRDLDRALKLKKPKRSGLHPHSLANLSKRKVA